MKNSEKTSGHSSVWNMFMNFLGIFGSRISGLVRDIFMTYYWGGSGDAQGAFNLAFSIPNLFRTLFGEGAFTAAFLPAVAGKLEKDDKEGAWRLAERSISLQIVALCIVVVLAAIVSLLLFVLTKGHVKPHATLAFKILPLLMPYALLICMTGSFAAILNSLRVFALPSLNPVVFNVVQVLSIVFLLFTLKNDDPKALYFFCGTVLLAGVLQMLMLAWACHRKGFTFHFRPVWNDADVKQVVAKFLPGTVGAGVNQINQMIDKLMVGWLGPLAVSGIEYSHRLVYLPVGLFGVAISNVCLTDMSRAAARKDSMALSESLDRALRITLFLSLPCAIMLGVLAEPFVRFLFRHGAYDDSSVRACVYAILFYVPGIPAMCCSKIALTPHHANLDTATPVRISMICVLLNFILNLSLIFFLHHGGLALATSICSWVNLIALLVLAKKYVPYWKPGGTLFAALKILVASGFGGLASWYAVRFVSSEITWTGTLASGTKLFTGGIAGYLLFFMICLLLCRREVCDLVNKIRKRGKA